MSPLNLRYPIACVFLASCCLAGGASAQTRTITTPTGETVTIDASQMQGDPFGGGPTPSQPPTADPRKPGKPDDPSKAKPKTDEGKPGNAKNAKPGEPGADGELKDVKRTSAPPTPPDPDELKVQPDEDGLIRFQFRNQPWPEVVRWLASVSNLSLDWQELPGDYINLATQRPYTIEETTDMINRALLSRGFTLLKDEGVLSVAKIDSLNPSMVPRIRPEELADMPPHSFVRTSFSLSWLIAEQVNEEFASMISKNGKLTPLAATNRLEAMDAAANLKDIYEILEQEQSLVALENLAREFPLRYARASSVKMQLEEFLGINSSSGGSSSSSRDAMRMMQQQMQQQMQQMQQRMQQQAAQRGGATSGSSSRQRSEDVYLVANDRSNSVIAHAEPDKMAIIASFIARVDVPNENAADFQRMSTRMKVFRLASLSPSELVASLTAMDVLEPTTRLQVDETNNAIIAYASVADQYLIQSVVERLDGSERTFEVIELRRLDAEAVAGSIKFLMGAEEEDSSSSNRRNSYYGFDYYGGRSSTPKKSDKMRVGANIQDNQVLLWANPIEMEEVQKLLVKLGEIPPEGGRRSTTRVIDASRQPETYEYLKRLKEQWERVSPNPIVIPEASEFAPTEDEASPKPSKQPGPEGEKPEKARADDEKITINQLDHAAAGDKLVSSPFQQSQETQESNDDAGSNASGPQRAQFPDPQLPDRQPLLSEPRRSAPQLPGENRLPGEDATQPGSDPVAIMIDEAGNLIIQSNDTAALDRLEEIMMTNRPPRKPYDIFKVKYATASWIALNLRDYFDNREDDESNRFFSFFFDERQRKDESQQLGKKPPLRFIYDNDTSSIVVQGANDMDRKTIKDLIELWDVPEPEDDEDTDRYTRLLRIKYSRAESIVNTIKEAYRDLLSATDKSVQQPGDGNEENKRSGGGGGVVQPSGGLSFAFKGKLSLGADPITNSILVSAEGEALMEIICDMIDQLDQAAQPEGNIEVYTLSAGVNGKSLEQALRAMLQSPSKQQGNQNPQQQAQQQAQEQQQAQQQARQRAQQSQPFQIRGEGNR